MLDALLKRRKALRTAKARLYSHASLKNEGARKYLRCLALLVATEMQIEELQGMKKDACQRPQ